MNSTFPFAEMDVTKFMANFKVPGFEYEALVEAQRKNVAAWQEVGERASKSFQTIAQRQVEMAQKGFEDVIAGAQDVATAATLVNQSSNIRGRGLLGGTVRSAAARSAELRITSQALSVSRTAGPEQPQSMSLRPRIRLIKIASV